MSTAHKSVERDTKQFYGDELRERGVELREIPGVPVQIPKESFVKEPSEVEAWRQTIRDQAKSAGPPRAAEGGDVFMAEPATLAQAQAGSRAQ